MMRRFLLILLVLAGCEDKEFVCRSGNDCIEGDGTKGLCLMAHCAFTDPQCASGYRYDDTAGDDADLCVGGDLIPDAAVRDGRPADAGP